MTRYFTLLLLTLLLQTHGLFAQHSVARRWNEVMLDAIRQDQARPPVQARNLFHVSMAMYDAWAVYESYAKTYLLGKTLGGVYYPFYGIPPVSASNTEAYRNEAISYAAYRVLQQRYAISPNASLAFYRFDTLMNNLGYDTSITARTYASGNPAHLGNYIASLVIQMGLNDSCHQSTNYNNLNYAPTNSALNTSQSGSSNMINPNRWQPLYIVNALDQNNIPIGSTQKFLGAEWGRGLTFCMPSSSATIFTRNGANYPVYMDPGTPPMLSLTDANDPSSLIFKWGHTMVAIWSSQLDPNDTTTVDISPNALGNNNYYPSDFLDQQSFYHYFNGGDSGKGYIINPVTNAPYTPEVVKLGDYTRVVSQYWADGPTSETPPGHWFVLLNEVSDHPLFQKKYEGAGPVLSDLEWDIKSYFTLGGAMHDAAIACWGIKGWYDSPRPISAIRKMAEYGQCTDSLLAHYHPAGLPLIPGYIELITSTDSLALVDPQNIDKIKIKSWRGFTNFSTPNAPIQTPTGVGWILAENWLPYQRKTFVTPPFAGYVSGHSTYSRAGATIMTHLTGNPYFPGGLSQHTITTASNFLQFETGPSNDITLQWATYKDASDQASLSRIWGGIHPPFDDIKGRLIGEQIGNDAYIYAKSFFNASFALPVHMAAFSATETNCNVSISWTTALEQNLSNYEIWRSLDGTHFDEKIGTIEAKGPSLGEQKYTFVDEKPLPQNYYKLRAIDRDFKTTESDIRYVKLSSCSGLADSKFASIYPNPVSNMLHVTISKELENGNATLTIFDVTGRIVLNQTLNLNNTNTLFNIPTAALDEGNYILKISLRDGSETKFKFSKE